MLYILCIEAIDPNTLEALLLEIEYCLTEERKDWLLFKILPWVYSYYWIVLSILFVIKVWNPVAGCSFRPIIAPSILFNSAYFDAYA